MKRSTSGSSMGYAIKKPRTEAPSRDPKTNMPAKKATPAADKVSNTTELVEQILLNLDLHDLTRSLRTNLFFRNVAFGSTKIKQALFLIPDPEPPMRYLIDSSEVLKIDESKLTDTPHACIYLKLEDKITYGRHILLPYHAYIDSNLRDMLVLQPPVAKISFTAKPRSSGQVIDIEVSNDSGVRIGDLVRAVMHTGMVGNIQFLPGYLRASPVCIATPEELRSLARMVGKCCPMGRKFMREASARRNTQ